MRHTESFCGVMSVALATVLLAAGTAMAATHSVKPGESIQAAINKAAPGDTIEVAAGRYVEALHIDKANIKLRGILEAGKWPQLDGEHRLNDGIIASGSGFDVSNLEIVNYKGNGITTQAADNVVMRNLIVRETGIYGIYPTLGTNILIEDTITSGIEDAAIYIGMCEHVDVRRNVTHASVAGIEVENSRHVLVEYNRVHNNAGGILVFTLPGLPKKITENIVVRNNFVFDNNHHNFGAPGSVVGSVPPGSGIIVLAGDQVTFENNIIENNNLAGIIIADHSVMPNMTPDPGMDPNPDGVRILHNLYRDNGNKDLGYAVTWTRFILGAAFAGGTPEGADSIMWPDKADIYSAPKGTGNCIKPGSGPVTTGTEHFTECPADATTRELVTMLNGSAGGNQMDPGEKVYASVCAGCHAYAIRAIGPPITEIQAKYKDNPDGISSFAMNPTKVRDGYPPMPSQQHLGKDKLLEAAKYLLSMKN